MPQELLFEQNDVRITPHVASFGSTSYQISSIGSVHVGQRKKRHPVVVVVFLLGLGALATAIGIPRDGIGRRLLSHGGNRGFVHGGSLSSSIRLAQALVCAGFEDIQWRRGRSYVTQKETCFQC